MEVNLNNSAKDEILTDVFAINEYVMFIYMWVVFGVICQAFNIFGVVTNIINIICFTEQRFQDSVNISLLGLSISDLGSLTTMTWTCVSLTPALMSADLPFDPAEVAYLTSAMVHFSFTRISACCTALITAERCLCIAAPLKVKSIITPRRTTVVIACIFIIFFISGIPVFIVNKLDMKYFPLRNRTIVGLVSTQERENFEKISFAINNFSIPVGVFIFIVICTIILSVKLRKVSQWRQKTMNSAQVERVSVRNQKTAKMVVMISILFIVCFVPLCITMLLAGFVPDMSVDGKLVHITLLISGLGHILESVNSSVNIFIYYHMSSKYKEIFNVLMRTLKVKNRRK